MKKWAARELDNIASIGQEALILDLGANIGCSTVLFKLKFPQSLVVCVEPNLSNFELLKKNTTKLGRIKYILGAISPDKGSYVLNDSSADYNALSHTPSTQGSVKGYTIEEIINETTNTHSPFVLKMDIEGFETAIFTKCNDYLCKFPIIFVEPHDWLLRTPSSTHGIYNFCIEHNYLLIMNGDTLLLIRIS